MPVPLRPAAPLTRRAALGLLLTGLALGGCGGLLKPPPMPELPKPPPPTTLVLNLVAAPGLNPTAAGQPAPLLVRVYALAGDGRLLGASPSVLFADDAAVLGADLLSREELRMLPGQHHRIEKDLAANTGAIGVLAAYRVTDGVRWRAALPVKSGEVNQFDLSLGASGLTLAPAP